jgi:hypothetical protein
MRKAKVTNQPICDSIPNERAKWASVPTFTKFRPWRFEKVPLLESKPEAAAEFQFAIWICRCAARGCLSADWADAGLATTNQPVITRSVMTASAARLNDDLYGFGGTGRSTTSGRNFSVHDTGIDAGL